MAEVSKHVNDYKDNQYMNMNHHHRQHINSKQKADVHLNLNQNHKSKSTKTKKAAQNEFVSKVVLWQTNPQKTNYTIYVKIVINPSDREPQEIRFAYQPDKESIESVIDEMIDALQLNPHLHHQLIVQSIQNAMKTRRMRIVQSSPINGHQQQQQQQQQQIENDIDNKMHEKGKKKKKNHKDKKKSSMHAPSLQLSPKKKSKSSNISYESDDDFEYFSPLSPLVVSPRTIHRKSTAKFPNLRIQSHSMSESDPLSLIKQVRYDDLYYNSNSNSHSGSMSNSRRNSHLIDDHYMDKYLHETVNDDDIIQ